MKSRRKAREAVLQALYQCDTLEDWSPASVQIFFECFKREELAAANEDSPTGVSSRENLEFAQALIRGVVDNLDTIDQHLAQASTHWSLGRMARVDRNILRLAVYEIAFQADIPTNVSINEAIEIAKSFGTLDSPMFINGVLDSVAGMISAGKSSAGGQPNLVLAKKKVVNG